MRMPCSLPALDQELAQQIIVSVTEAFVFIFSVVASYLHFTKANSRRISLEVTFHFLHVNFCAVYVGYHAILTSIPGICLCDDINALFVLELGLFAAALAVFIRYWELTIHGNDVKAVSQNGRIAVYTVLFAGFSFAHFWAKAQKPCKVSSFLFPLGVQFISVNVVLLDLSLVVRQCVKLLLKKGAFHGSSWRNRATTQALLFVSVPLCIVVSIITSLLDFATGSRIEVEQIFGILLPSLITLFLMWDRHYLSSTPQDEIELDWVSSNSLLQSHSARMSLEQTRKETLFGCTDRAISDETLGLDVLLDTFFTPPLKSSFASPIRTSDANGTMLNISEELSPAASLTPVLLAYLTDFLLPTLSSAYDLHKKRSAALLKVATPAPGKDDLASVELAHKYHRLEMKCDTLTLAFGAFMRRLRAELTSFPGPRLASSGDDSVGYEWPFKSSAKKKSEALAHATTNLFEHATTMSSTSSTARSENVIGKISFSTITFGAPTAHSLGYGYGGLRELKAKLEKNIVQADHKRSLELMFDQLILRFELKARQSVVYSQALCAIAAACADRLKTCCAARDAAALKLWARCGLLVHSVCLLSTSGKEEGMLDDFAGAYQDLDVTLRLSIMDVNEVEGGGDLVVRGMAPTSSVSSSIPSSSTGPSSVSSSNGSAKTQRRVRESIDCLLEDFSPTLAPSISITNLDDEESAMSGDVSPPVAGTNDLIPPVEHASILPPQFEQSCDFNSAFTNISRVTVHIGVSRDIWDWVVAELNPTPEAAAINTFDINVVTVLFNLGVNEMQTLANKAGSTGMQTEINRQGAASLRAYYDAALAETSSSTEEATTLDAAPLTTSEFKSFDLKKVANLLVKLDNLIEVEAREKSKLVDLLLVSCFAARSMHGARTTSCKSAKDRTAIFQSLEASRLAQQAGLLNRESEGELLDRLRGLDGVRLRNCEVNIGRPKYSFNQLQLQALPQELRPPAHTALGGKS